MAQRNRPICLAPTGWREHPSNWVMILLLCACAIAILLMPLSDKVRSHWIKAMHGCEQNAAVMAGVQVVPKMYNFANRYALSKSPLSEEMLSNPPESLPEKVEFHWLNHYPARVLTSNPLVLFDAEDPKEAYLYLLTGWQSTDTITSYGVKLEKRPPGSGAILVEELER